MSLKASASGDDENAATHRRKSLDSSCLCQGDKKTGWIEAHLAENGCLIPDIQGFGSIKYSDVNYFFQKIQRGTTPFRT